MDFSSHSKHRIGVIWPLEYSGVAGIALFQVVRGEKAHSILSYKHRIKCRLRVYFSPEIQRYTMSYRAIGLILQVSAFRRSEKKDLWFAFAEKTPIVLLSSLRTSVVIVGEPSPCLRRFSAENAEVAE